MHQKFSGLSRNRSLVDIERRKHDSRALRGFVRVLDGMQCSLENHLPSRDTLDPMSLKISARSVDLICMKSEGL